MIKLLANTLPNVSDVGVSKYCCIENYFGIILEFLGIILNLF